MKICSRCKQNKQDFEFSKKTKTRLNAFCKECNKEYLREHYQKNKESYYKRREKWKKKYKAWFQEYKSTLKCEKCPEDHPACLDFHHKDSKNKDSEVSTLVGNSSPKAKVIAEIKKCIVLCSNCHRKLHYNDRGIA